MQIAVEHLKFRMFVFGRRLKSTTWDSHGFAVKQPVSRFGDDCSDLYVLNAFASFAFLALAEFVLLALAEFPQSLSSLAQQTCYVCPTIWHASNPLALVATTCYELFAFRHLEVPSIAKYRMHFPRAFISSKFPGS